MNPADYQPRDFLWSQRDIRWGWKKLALSGKTVANIGCAIMSTHYIHSRYRKDHNLPIIYPSTWIDWLNAKARAAGYQRYLTSGAALYWNSLDEFSGGHVVHTYNPAEARYTLTEYKWGNITHWTVNLNGDVAYNPYPTTLVPILTNRFNPQWVPTGRKQYYKVV